MSNEKKIKPVINDEIKVFKDEFKCSISHARNVLEERNIHEYINECETVDELKKVLHLLISKIYKSTEQ